MLEEVEDTLDPGLGRLIRMYDWVLNARDWCISRQRYWGIPTPVWTCASCGEMKVIGSIAELETMDGYRKDMELHRPWIDSVTCACPKCNKSMKRVPDVLDVWFDSAVASWAQLGFPREAHRVRPLVARTLNDPRRRTRTKGGSTRSWPPDVWRSDAPPTRAC